MRAEIEPSYLSILLAILALVSWIVALETF
jgi:hypothetical protein